MLQIKDDLGIFVSVMCVATTINFGGEYVYSMLSLGTSFHIRV